MQSAARTVVVLGTGGTIAGLADDPGEHLRYASAQLGVEALAAAVGLPGVALETEQVAQIDSKDMDFSTWLRLARRVEHHLARPEVAGIVVTHGTDTMEETAYFLSRVVAAARPVVLTGAMRPASARDADGPRNLADAVAVAASGAENTMGVVVVFAGEIHAAGDVRKAHPTRLAAFSSGEAGPVGSVVNGVVHLARPKVDAGPTLGVDALAADAAAWPWVEIVTSDAGADGRAVAALAGAGVEGIVVAATGNGTVHRGLAPALDAAVRRGVVAWRSSRCTDGSIVEPTVEGAAANLPACGLTPVKARIALMLDLLVGRAGGRLPGRSSEPPFGSAAQTTSRVTSMLPRVALE